ncbi:alpha/beta hydrolase family protein [Maribacter luteus]|uniref:alpha/beta hydrolase family protein n=1 Tax=Maribacter luteus TaxID=2594478 RepID=UPI00248FF0E8|nr:alpha/beta hydrolase [Maribacter luteus]
MRIELIISFMVSVSIFGQNISGDWRGEMDIQGNKLRLSFEIKEDSLGYTATMAVPQQNLSDLEMERVVFMDSILTISMPPMNMKYSGRLINGNQIDGQFEQNGIKLPLSLTKGGNGYRRPQEPIPPYDYVSREVMFENQIDNIVLSGTLTIPKSSSAYPVIIIVGGSGPQNRDGQMFAHKPYLVISDYLTKNRIGTFRYDERGVGNSEGDLASVGFDEQVNDLDAAIDFIKKNSGMNPSSVGVIGHSLGGILATDVAVKRTDIDFIVLMASPGVNGKQLLLSQKAVIEKKMGAPNESVQKGQEIFGGVYDIIIRNERDTASKDSIYSYLGKKMGKDLSKEQITSIADQLTSPEITGILRSRPSELLEKLNCPVLAINGSNDLQVDPKENLSAIEIALSRGGNKDFKVMELQGLNHLFQESNTGLPNEYSELEQTISPKALEIITEWIRNRAK